MKPKKMSISVVITITALSLCILPAIANADRYDCKKCTITKLAVRPGVAETTYGFMVKVEDAAGEWNNSRTFYLSEELGKAGWATILLAYSMGKTLRLRLADTVPGSFITQVQISN
jgi:hypothetical protein